MLGALKNLLGKSYQASKSLSSSLCQIFNASQSSKADTGASNHVLGHSLPIRPDIAICGHSDESWLFLSQDTLWGLWQWVWVRVVWVHIEGRGQDHLGGKIWAWMHGWLNRCLGCLVLESVVWCCWMFVNHVIQAIIAREKLSSMLIPLSFEFLPTV